MASFTPPTRKLRAPSHAPLGPSRDLVVLVPGFLGFERLGGFAYFADHLAATLRAALETRTRRRTPVVPLSTLPAGSLVARQTALMQQLAFWAARFAPERIHLVTHSAGGVDAYFLTAAKTLAGTAWTAAEQVLRARIATIVTMGAPFLGTTLSDSEIGRFAAGSRALPSACREVVGLATGVLHLILENDATLERLGAIAGGVPAAAGMLRQLARHRELIAELSPARMLERYTHLVRSHTPRLAFFATYVDPPTRENSSSLFRRLYGYTGQHLVHPVGVTHLEANRKLLMDARPILPTPVRPTLTLTSNDGVVNTLRQLPPGARPEEVAGLVVADHADLLGYFDRVDPSSGREQQISIFRSGARFRDDQFFELFDAIAQQLQ